MKKIKLTTSYDKKNEIYSLNLDGVDFHFSFHTKDKENFEFKKKFANAIIKYYENE